MKKFMFLFGCLLFILTACNGSNNSNEDPDTQVKGATSEMLDVLIRVPETVTADEEVTIEALVTQGDDLVENADEVVFEVWRSGEDDREMMESIHQGDGVYSINTIFDEQGTYFVVAHATARNMHHMPRQEITVSAKQ
ncbi:hypothetical protein HNQ94_000790 [Salirhabdus euzebyi]|uniref:YtkA-like domain-containing protein n=1 Tax=Salirhabdus euzebyi TaxID=394506 RepID=A0A841Q2A9_9BACI|nr:FixH family protein [Salirhabdus euzebyi]MBB6452345.1 hypothetical protein [Salirhabdus euzebyi]